MAKFSVCSGTIHPRTSHWKAWLLFPSREKNQRKIEELFQFGIEGEQMLNITDEKPTTKPESK